MLIDFETAPSCASGHGSAGARGEALTHMTKALHHLDSDASIPSIVAAQLQGAIDALWRSLAADPGSLDAH